MKRNNCIALSLSALALAGMASCGNKSADATDTVDSTFAVDTAVVEQVDSAAIAAEAARQDSIAKAEAEKAPVADPKIEKELNKFADGIKSLEEAANDPEVTGSLTWFFSELDQIKMSLQKKESKMTPEQKKRFKELSKKIS